MAIDASMCMYQFLIAVTRAEGAHLTDADGDTTRSADCHVTLLAPLKGYNYVYNAMIVLGNGSTDSHNFSCVRKCDFCLIFSTPPPYV